MFQPTAAVLVHTLVPMDESVLAILKGETALLIHRCVARAEDNRRAWSNSAGREVLVIYTEAGLTWDIQASVLSQTGLANYHPGRALSARALQWANGASIPFQFRTTDDTVFIYEAPQLDPAPADLPTISFRIRPLFLELDTTTYPDVTATEPPPTEDPPESYVQLPIQATVEASDPARTAVLTDLFQGTDTFSAADLTIKLWDIDPDAPDAAQVMETLTLDPWTSTAEGTEDYITAVGPDAAFSFTDTSESERTATRATLHRGTLRVAVIPFAEALVIPAYSGVTIPVGGLRITFTWPLDSGALPATLAARPATRAALWLAGGDKSTQFPGATTITVATYADSAALAAGTITESWDTTPGAGVWAVSDDTVAPATTITSDNNAPGPGWSISNIVCRIGTIPILSEVLSSAPLTFTSGNPIVFDSTDFTMDLDTAPDL